MLKLIAVLGWVLGLAIGYVIGFRGGRPLLGRSGRTQKFRLKTIDKGEKLFERFTWVGALAAFWPVSGINKVPVPTRVFASIDALTFCLPRL
jgi:membrane protein DedA with SNARE-associated domain